jgi:hypothetical protein
LVALVALDGLDGLDGFFYSSQFPVLSSPFQWSVVNGQQHQNSNKRQATSRKLKAKKEPQGAAVGSSRLAGSALGKAATSSKPQAKSKKVPTQANKFNCRSLSRFAGSG